MNATQLVPCSFSTVSTSALAVPQFWSPTERAAERFLEFFTANIRNPNTRRAYGQAAGRFAAFCEQHGLGDICQVKPLHVAAYIEQLTKTHAKPTAKQHLAAIRMLLDWLVTGQIVQTNPAHAVRGPRHSVRKGKTPVLTPDETRDLLDSIETTTIIGLRDRALIGLMVYTFARVGAATAMNIEDFFVQGRRSWVRLHEKGGKQHELPCHHNLDQYLEEYVRAAGLADGPLFRTTRAGKLTAHGMSQSDVYTMVRRRAAAAGIRTRIGCHSFRATGITAYLSNGGKLEIAQRMANHESARTTGLYDRRGDAVSLDEVEKIAI